MRMIDSKEMLINAVIENKAGLSYINLDENNQYLGWVNDFNIRLPNRSKMTLDLQDKYDLFLLFVLASSWSKTGPWENAAYFVTYLKTNNLSNPEYWLIDENVNTQIILREKSAKEIVKSCVGIEARKKVSFRIDFYSSIKTLATEWARIVYVLEKSNEKDNYMLFIQHLSEIRGLGARENRMRIKIPLILRELRCQNYFNNIPGNLCCVPDVRVIKASSNLGIKLPLVNSLKSLLKASGIIYDNFGDLYDIPLFAYEDIINETR